MVVGALDIYGGRASATERTRAPLVCSLTGHAVWCPIDALLLIQAFARVRASGGAIELIESNVVSTRFRGNDVECTE